MENRALHFLAMGVGILLLFHGVDKLIHGTEDIEKILIGFKVPYAHYVTYGVYIGEIIAPLFLVFGKYIKVASAVIAVTMLVVIFLFGQNSLFMITEDGAWGVEVPMLYLIVSLTFILWKNVYNHDKVLGHRALRFLAFSLGALLLFHGMDKLLHGTEDIEKMLLGVYVPPAKHGICSFCMGEMFYNSMLKSAYSPYAKYLSYGVYITEVVAPLFLIFGQYIKSVAVIVVFNMLLILFLGYKDSLLKLGEYGAWSAEVPMLYLIIALTLVFWKREK